MNNRDVILYKNKFKRLYRLYKKYLKINSQWYNYETYDLFMWTLKILYKKDYRQGLLFNFDSFYKYSRNIVINWKAGKNGGIYPY